MGCVSAQPPVSPRRLAPPAVTPTDAAPSLSRRTVLKTGASLSVGGAAAALAAPARAATPREVFAHGVASGDPLPEAIILWTRITPTPAARPGSGAGTPCAVTWEMARDESFTTIVATGSTQAGPDTDFTVKVDAAGLTPNTRYHYRFRVTSGPAAGATSPLGRTRTAPAAGAEVAKVRFGVVSCANWEAGYFAAYRHLAQQPDLDAIVHLGDYIYEYGTGEYTAKYDRVVRKTTPVHDVVTLADYRTRHAQYKTDPDLAELHRRYPWICTWDDHESADNAWSGGAEDQRAPGWPARKAAAERAYYEWMPVRPAADADGRHLYRRLRYGQLLELSMLDLRTYRSKQARWSSDDIDDPARTITGARQMRWLTDGITSSPTRWKIVGNPVMITPILLPPLEPAHTRALTDLLGTPSQGFTYNPDQWDGYSADRQRLLDAIGDVDDVVFITGDVHSSWACDVPVNPANYPSAGTVATELVVTSVTSSNIDEILNVPENTAGAVVSGAMTNVNRHVRYNDFDAHGYAVLTVTGQAVQMDWYFVRDKTQRGTGQYRAASYRVRSGVARVQRVGAAAR